MATATFKEIRQDDFRGDISQFQLQNRDTTQEMNTFTDLVISILGNLILILYLVETAKER